MIDHLSYSSISRYLKCGLQWKYRYIDKLHEDDSDALLIGSAWHKMIRSYLQGNDNLGNAWTEAISEITPEMTDEQYAEVAQVGMRMLLVPKIHQTIQGLKVKPESLEMETELHIPGVPVPIVGYIDMISNSGVPIDIKTSSRKWSQSRADSSLQATFYIAALEQLRMVKLPAKFRFVVFTKTKNPVAQILETERTYEDVFSLYGRVQQVWQAISREVFPPTDPSNWWCSSKYCGFWDICEYGGKNVAS